DALQARAQVKRLQRLPVADAGIAHPARVLPVTVFGADAGVVQAGGDRMYRGSLAVLVLQDVAETAVQHAGLAVAQRRGVVAGAAPAPARLDADQLDGAVGHERVEHAGRVAAAAHTGDDGVRQPARLLLALLPRLAADDRLEVADHDGEGVRPDDAA